MTSQTETNVWTRSWTAAVGAVLFVFLAAAIVIGNGGYLTNPAASLIVPIGVTAVVPVALFLATFAASARFRGFVLAQDLRILTMMHLWRVVGFTFLLLYAFDTLPAVFAIPAGVGDVAIGVAAIFIVARMERDPGFVRAKGFARFHLLGLLDFAVAVGTSGLAAGAIPPNWAAMSALQWRRGRHLGTRGGRHTGSHPRRRDQRGDGRLAAQYLPELHRAAVHRPASDGAAQSPRIASRRRRDGGRGGSPMTDSAHPPLTAAPSLWSLLNRTVLLRAGIVAVVLGAALTLINQGRAVFGADAFQWLPMVQVLVTPFVVVAVAQLLGIRQAIGEGHPASERDEALWSTPLSHGILPRAVLLGLLAGTVNTSVGIAAAALQGDDLSALPLAPIGQAYLLPVLFGALSQSLAYRRARRQM